MVIVLFTILHENDVAIKESWLFFNAVIMRNEILILMKRCCSILKKNWKLYAAGMKAVQLYPASNETLSCHYSVCKVS